MEYLGYAILIIGFIGSLFYIFPLWNVWAAHKSGLADLAQAQNEQQCRVAEAKGRRDAANLNKEAAIIEAEAVAAQIASIGKGLTEHDLYLKWQWIKMMEDRTGSTIYVPTECNLPVLEAGRLGKI
jgi:hypothetical protein